LSGCGGDDETSIAMLSTATATIAAATATIAAATATQPPPSQWHGDR
jgi:hypothetical protein